MDALEMQFAALKTATASVSHRAINHKDALDVAEVDAVRLLRRCETFAWSADTTKAVWEASRSIPQDARLKRDAFQRPMWWWFDWPLPIPMTNNTSDDVIGLDATTIAAILLQPEPTGLYVTDFRMSTALGPIVTSWWQAPLGVSLSDILSADCYDFTHQNILKTSSRVAALARFVLAAIAWLDQRIIVQSSGHIERHRRKQLAREFDATISDVQVIQLRRVESGSTNESLNCDPIEWSCRWIVNGHWRNQYHPSTGKHELKYILPYVKGPEDKPLKVPTHTVYAVNR